MPRCWKCGSTDLAPLLGDNYQCNVCAFVTDASTGRGPAEGLFSNGDMLASECVAYMIAHHPDEYRMLADTVAGQPDPGTAPGGAPLTDTAPTAEPTEAPAEPTTEPPAAPDTPTEAPPAEPEGSPSPEPVEPSVEQEPEAATAPAPEAPTPEEIAAAEAVLDAGGIQHG